MKPERWQQLDQLFHDALERDPVERAAFLDEACDGDESLRKQVEALLAARREAASFMESPAMEVEARGVAADLGSADTAMATGEAVSHYRIISPLGTGGMGDVYLAQDTVLSRQVALKLLPEYFTRDRDRLRRFQQEARTASTLNHPNIVTIHEIGQVNNRHFIATEFIDGLTVRQHFFGEGRHSSGNPLELREVLDIAIQTADALAAAHEAGIVHRDIKPDNIMLRRRDGYVKVLDFGLAKLTEGEATVVDAEALTRIPVKTSPGVVMGTVSYMSPEQARGEKVDARTDIWSLGVVVYEMVAGCSPFERSTQNEVLASILGNKEPPPLARYSREVPAELERIVSKALTRDRDARYQTAKDLLVDLRRLRRRLEVEAEIERTAESQAKRSELKAVATSSEQKAAVTAQAAAVETRDATSAHATSSLVQEIKLHKGGSVLVLAALVALTATVIYFAYSRYAGGSGAGPIRSVAVLPFTNTTGNPDTEYLSDGISESLINGLSQLPGVKVIARSSSFKYKGKNADPQDVANALGVEAILTGTVLQRGDNLLISVELMDARDKTHVWGEQYNRKSSDLLFVQSEISREIAGRLRLKLSGPEKEQLTKRPTDNIKAFQYYMQGRSYVQRMTRDDLLQAVRYCEKATDEDSNYALAYAGLAQAYGSLGVRGYVAPLESRRRMDEAARKALSLDENLAEAHVAVGTLYLTFAPYNFSAADRELQSAIAISPSLAMAHQFLGLSFARQGRLDESLEELLKARELDPLSPIIARHVALPYFLKRNYERALELLRQADELGPALGTTWEIEVYTQNRLFNETLAELEKAKEERKSDPILIYGTGMVYAAQGKRADALQIIKELEEMSGPDLTQGQYIAKIYAALNEKELALTWLERALAAGAIGSFFKDEPVWDTIRRDPRFTNLLQRMVIAS